MLERFSKNHQEYSYWDGTQYIELFDTDDILHALSDDYLEDGNLGKAFSRLVLRGFRIGSGPPIIGLREMLVRLRDQRKQQLNRYNMASGVMDNLREELEKIRQLESNAILYHLNDMSEDQPILLEEQSKNEQQVPQWLYRSQSRNGQISHLSQAIQYDSNYIPPQMLMMLKKAMKEMQEYLDLLPNDILGLVNAFSAYDFLDDQAREQFLELLENLQQQIIQQFFPNMLLSSPYINPQGIASLHQMICSLNTMCREHQEGKEADFSSFIHQYGGYFPFTHSMDHLIEQIWQQMAAMQGVLDNLQADQRQDLQNLLIQISSNSQIGRDLMELASCLEAAVKKNIRTHFPFQGDESLPLSAAMCLMNRLQRLESLEGRFHEARQLGNIEVIDSDQVRELLGDEEYRSIEYMKAMKRKLEENGYIQIEGKHWKLTARGIRKLSQNALQDIFDKLKRNHFGQHLSRYRGPGNEQIDESKAYQFGDPLLLNLEKTLMNSLQRRSTMGLPIQLAKEDFEVYRTEQSFQASTVLLIDTSLSMIYNGCSIAAKKVAIALESLIRSQFPRDNLHIVGFSFIAREYKPNELIEMSNYDYDRGTNMVHGFMLARQLLSRHRGDNKQIIMITDGGPTVWYEERYGGWQFAYPSPYAEQQTLREVLRCTREGITISTFMLYDDDWMVTFVNELTEINRGRIFYTNKDNLGEVLVVDYLQNKQRFRRE